MNQINNRTVPIVQRIKLYKIALAEEGYFTRTPYVLLVALDNILLRPLSNRMININHAILCVFEEYLLLVAKCRVNDSISRFVSTFTNKAVSM